MSVTIGPYDHLAVIPITYNFYTQKTPYSLANLNTSHFLNGDLIPEITESQAWTDAGSNGQPAWCYYNNDSSLGNTYGKLYNFWAFIDPRKIAPVLWSIPSTGSFNGITYDWSRPIDWMQTGSIWSTNNGTNNSGFTALPGGYRRPDGVFEEITETAAFWTTNFRGDGAYIQIINSLVDPVTPPFIASAGVGASIRCISFMESNPWQTISDSYINYTGSII